MRVSFSILLLLLLQHNVLPFALRRFIPTADDVLEQLCGSLGHEAWLLWGHHPLSHRTTVLLAKKRL